MKDRARRNAMKFVLLIGIVSLFSDMTYEGARSITGPFLYLLGASAATVGLVSGFGEFAGYALRLATGYAADRTGRYWLLTLLGYAINLLSVPLLAFAGRWEAAAVLIFLERTGKAIRTPARDTMLSHATHQVGRGWGFGIHEALDQLGAVSGPVLMSVLLYFRKGYHASFAVLIVPAVLALSVLTITRVNFPTPRGLEAGKRSAAGRPRPGSHVRLLSLYSLFTGLSVLGYAHFQLISYHLKASSVLTDSAIPAYFALAMGVDAGSALIVGWLYDRIGFRSLAMIPLLTMLLPFLVFSTSIPLVAGGVIAWGTVMGMHETVMRAGIADITPSETRGVAYGVFNTVYGLCWLLGSTLMGMLYAKSIAWVVAFGFLSELASVPILFYFLQNARHAFVRDP